MSKINDTIIDQKNFEEAEKNFFLEQSEPVTDEEVRQRFGSIRKYHLMLAIKTHPRHNEAIDVCNRRRGLVTRKIDHEQSRGIEHARDAHFATLRANYDF